MSEDNGIGQISLSTGDGEELGLATVAKQDDLLAVAATVAKQDDLIAAVATGVKQDEQAVILEDIKMLVTLPQDLTPTGFPTFAGETLTGLTASRIVVTDADKELVSIDSDITAAELEELSDGSESILHSHAAAGAGFTSKISVSLGATQLIDAYATAKILFATESYDVDNEYDSSSNFRFTATEAGYYHVSATAFLQTVGANKTIPLYIYVNGGMVKICYDRSILNASYTGKPISADLYLAANDYVEIFIGNADVADRNCIALSWLDIHRFA